MEAMDVAVVSILESHITTTPLPGMESSNRAAIAALLDVIELGDITNPTIVAEKLRKIIDVAKSIELVYGDFGRLKKFAKRAEMARDGFRHKPQYDPRDQDERRSL